MFINLQGLRENCAKQGLRENCAINSHYRFITVRSPPYIKLQFYLILLVQVCSVGTALSNHHHHSLFLPTDIRYLLHFTFFLSGSFPFVFPYAISRWCFDPQSFSKTGNFFYCLGCFYVTQLWDMKVMLEDGILCYFIK